ncbi:PQQ-dependent sugar dehydrogenase [Ilyomonas limi]|nr:PQQ-dependent sugar dehydrogenase [Ilyomonas limi]
MKTSLATAVCFCAMAIGTIACKNSSSNPETESTSSAAQQSASNNKAGDSATLTLPAGFSAATVAENLSGPRHLVVTPQNDIYVKLSDAKNGKGIVILHVDGNGKATTTGGFGDYGGTGITIKNGYLYASSNDDVYRYKLDANNRVINENQPEKIATGLTNKGMHNSKSLVLDNAGNIYVNIGAPSNVCAEQGNDKKGMQPCPILETAGGIWMFKADKQAQKQNDGVHYATGLRNVVGMDWNNVTNSLFVMQHGRDNLHNASPQNYTEQQSAELPAECMYELHQGANAGWPYMYYDQNQHKKLVNPEYGGDGKKEADASYIDPVVAFPGHMAPDGLLFYTGNMFPEKYKNGAFIAFHGSWNRAPEPQKGYLVAFVPFNNGKPSGNWEIFADGFTGGQEFMQPGKARHRPCGLAQGPDGSLYVSDDAGGTIYRITYHQ